MAWHCAKDLELQTSTRQRQAHARSLAPAHVVKFPTPKFAFSTWRIGLDGVRGDVKNEFRNGAGEQVIAFICLDTPVRVC